MYKPYLNENNLKRIVDKWGCTKENYIKRFDETINKAMEEYPRLLVIRVDLRYPKDPDVIAKLDSGVITRTLKSLSEKILADGKRKQKKGLRLYPCKVRYIWVREFGDNADNKHYHVLLLLNKDRYYRPGDITQKGSLGYMIKSAWASAIGVAYSLAEGLVEFPTKCCYWIMRNDKREMETFDKVMFRTSYFAKLATKVTGDGERNFGCSQG